MERDTPKFNKVFLQLLQKPNNMKDVNPVLVDAFFDGDCGHLALRFDSTTLRQCRRTPGLRLVLFTAKAYMDIHQIVYGSIRISLGRIRMNYSYPITKLIYYVFIKNIP